MLCFPLRYPFNLSASLHLKCVSFKQHILNLLLSSLIIFAFKHRIKTFCIFCNYWYSKVKVHHIAICCPSIFICSFLHLTLYHISHHAPEKAMALHSSTLAWKIPWTAEPGGLQSIGSLRVGHDWATSLSLFTFMHWRGKWQPTTVFLPGESQGWGSLVGCHLWGCTGSDTTQVT